ncbi:MAG TPA: AMP-binding protein, partial [Dehalococcoidia bacterium]|nr:AMP-binding protein [Dehalococcoidia bacterium]
MTAMHVWRSHLTPLRFLERSAAVFRERPAVVYGEIQCTYGQFSERVNRLASALRSQGIEKGDRVAFLAPNIPPLLEAHFAVPLAGAILVAINTRLGPEEVRYILDHSGAKLLFVDTELNGLIEPLLGRLESTKRLVNVVDIPGCKRLDGPDYEEFLKGASPEPMGWLLEDEEDVISINYTSGTTGSPKGVMYTHRGAYLNALGEVIQLHLDSDSVFLWTLPMFHCNGWCCTWAVTAVGGRHVCQRQVSPAAIWDLVLRQGVTHFNAAPTVLISLLNDPAAARLKLEHKLVVTTAGAPPSPTLIGQVEALGVEIVHAYGLTETYGPYTVCEWHPHWNELPAAERARLKARQGVPYVTADDVRVVDQQMRDVPPDGETMGEVIMRGNDVMKGYYRQPEATAQAFAGGWFHSGDIGVMHADGYIELRDRKKDIIISGGENVSTIEVERALAQHPDVLEVAVVA